jgi:hypothetical protein
MFSVEKVALFCNPLSGGTFLSAAIEIIKWVTKFAVAQAKVTHILRPGKVSGKTPKGVIPPSLCEISLNASRKKNPFDAEAWDIGRHASATNALSDMEMPSKTHCVINPLWTS